MTDLEILFQQRARRGSTRGADLVLGEARADLAHHVTPGAAESLSSVATCDDPTVDDLEWQPDDSDTSPNQNRWIGIGLAAAVTVLLLVGLTGLLDRSSDELETGPGASPGVTESVSVPIVADPDGFQWTRVIQDDAVFGSFGETATKTEMGGVTIGGPGLVAVGSHGWDDDGDRQIDDSDAVVWTSVDGLTWSRVPSDEAVFGGEGLQEMWTVTAGGPGLIATGMDGPLYREGLLEEYGDAAIWTSVDGVAWSRVPHDDATFGGVAINSVTAGGPGLVGVGRDDPDYEVRDSNAVVWTSVDGLTWDRVPHDETVFGGAQMSDVTVGGPGLVAVGGSESGAVVWTSVDGLTWDRVALEGELAGEWNEGRGAQMIDVIVGGPGLIAVGDGGYWSSADGIRWTLRPVDERTNFPINDVTITGSQLVAIGWKGLWTSVDGRNWSQATGDAWPPGINHLSTVIAGGPGLVVVGGAKPPGGCCGDVAAVWVGIKP